MGSLELALSQLIALAESEDEFGTIQRSQGIAHALNSLLSCVLILERVSCFSSLYCFVPIT